MAKTIEQALADAHAALERTEHMVPKSNIPAADAKTRLLERARVVAGAEGITFNEALDVIKRRDPMLFEAGTASYGGEHIEAGRLMPNEPTITKAGVGYALVFPNGQARPFYSSEMATYYRKVLKRAEKDGVTFTDAFDRMRKEDPEVFDRVYRAEELAKNEANAL
jgi:hypothetical protein